ncbi:restriction endonuclease subunit S [Flavobacterium hungaricum]|uniref:Restriction endonuclease subunit S n=1 Tax=Flavobacterium hungaricum TaxID=2082725 RepID=A0ABR9TDH3_9FLAO|nr:restriction endonuclease subunit S [Flavobacterium hungaricum]MBE8723401.1 restriction endonuclease subunit S [Flavobacterium hungaricum]
MNKYQLVLLKDVAYSQTGPFGSQLHQSDYASEGTPMVTVEHLGIERFTHQNLPLVSDKDRERLSKYMLREGDIVFSRVGSVDRCTYVTKEEDGWMFSGRCIRVRTNENANGRYLNFYFRQDEFKKMMLNISVGATMPSLNTKLMDNIPLSLPSLTIQNKIAKILSDLDTKIELNNKINAELEAMAKTLYDYWFVQFDFPDVNGNPYKSSGGKMVYNAELKREIPEGWKKGTLNNIGEIIGGSTPSKAINENFSLSEGTPWITPKDLSVNKGKKFISRGEYNVTQRGLKETSLKIMPAGTVLLSSRAPIGYLAIARTNVTTNQGFKSFVPKETFFSEYIYYTIQNLISVIEANSSGSTFKEVSSSVLKTIKTILPKEEVLLSFYKKVNTIFKKQNCLELENQQLASLRDWLLPMLMNGQVTIEEAEEALEIVAEGKVKYKKR